MGRYYSSSDVGNLVLAQKMHLIKLDGARLAVRWSGCTYALS